MWRLMLVISIAPISMGPESVADHNETISTLKCSKCETYKMTWMFHVFGCEV